MVSTIFYNLLLSLFDCLLILFRNIKSIRKDLKTSKTENNLKYKADLKYLSGNYNHAGKVYTSHNYRMPNTGLYINEKEYFNAAFENNKSLFK